VLRTFRSLRMRAARREKEINKGRVKKRKKYE
jgi:hypothetical protein